MTVVTNNNKWGDKCITNFSGLTETSSKESIQTFVKWIFFNRKQYRHFITALQKYISTAATGSINSSSTVSSSSSSSIYSILLTILHEVFILNYGTTDKWNMTLELRVAFGESLVVPYILQFPKTKFEIMIQQWDTYNVFETPTILRQIRSKLLTTGTTASTTTTTPPVEAAVVEKQPELIASKVNEEISTISLTPAVDTATTAATAAAAVADDIHPPATGTEDKTDMIIASTETDEGIVTTTATALAETSVIPVVAETVTANTIESNELSVLIIHQGDQSSEAIPPVVRSRKGKSRLKTDDDVVVIEKEKDALDLLIEGKTNRTTTTLLSPTTATGMTKFDFDAHTDIPRTKVHPNEFIEPCRLIATLQIARDLRNDSAVQISSLLQTLPESVRRFIAEAAESMEETRATSSTYELSDSTAREFVNIMNEQLLDMNIMEQLENVKTFMELIQRQRKARETIHHLLMASRCQFGADDVAATYYSNMNEVYTTLKQRAQILADAMDLEGFEVQPVNPAIAAMTQLDNELLPFPWYNHNHLTGTNENDDTISKDNTVAVAVESPEGVEGSDDVSPNKRQKT